MISNCVLFFFFQNLIFDFAFLDVPQIFADQVFRVGRVLLNQREFPGQGVVRRAKIDEAGLKPALLVIVDDDVMLRHGSRDLSGCPWKAEYSSPEFIDESGELLPPIPRGDITGTHHRG